MESATNIDIQVKGIQGEGTSYNICPDITIADFKKKIMEKNPIIDDSKSVLLYFKGKILVDEKTLTEQGIGNLDVLMIILQFK